VAFGDVQFSTLTSSVANPTFVHTPTHVPKAVMLTAAKNTISSTTALSSVSYAGNQLTKQVVAVDSAGELGTAEIWAVTSTSVMFSSGAATVAIGKASTASFQYVCFTVFADGNITVASTNKGAEDQNTSNATVSIAKAGALRWAFGCAFSGVGSTSESTMVAGITRVADLDLGNQCLFHLRESTAGTADITFGYTQTADDWALVAIAIQEEAVGGGGGSMHRPWRMGVLGVN
jgi:hypothetical protein